MNFRPLVDSRSVSQEILSGKPFIIGVSGGGSSGKQAVCNMVRLRLPDYAETAALGRNRAAKSSHDPHGGFLQESK
jgi:pantothenate kinase-related protein Tda10